MDQTKRADGQTDGTSSLDSCLRKACRLSQEFTGELQTPAGFTAVDMKFRGIVSVCETDGEKKR